MNLATMKRTENETATGLVSADAPRRIERSLEELLCERLRRRESGAAAPGQASIEEIQAQLEKFLSINIEGPFAVQSLKRMSGGGANESYRFTLVRGDLSETLVLRIKALGACCETHVPREFQMMQAVHGVLPTSKPYWVAADHSHFGAPALICGFVPGIQAPPSAVVKATGMGTRYGEPLRKLLAPQFVRYEATLHAFDWQACDLGHFDKPRPGTTDAIDWRLAFWDRVWEEDKIEEHPTMLLARDWLWANRPIVDRVSLLHGDFRNGNFLYAPETGEITGVLDWELCSLGDRHCDLGYTMLRAWGHDGPDGKFLNSGLMDTEAFIAEYERVSGLKVDTTRLHYYLVFAIYWSAVALYATAIRNADARLTQLDVMYNLIAGKGGFDIGELNRLVVEK
ncbi:phosphotransferase family protein [Paraburkholderia sp.]|uniref:phosphotransferase family protein n=1 Tax=Paraburkholderia sp. TaxID=1926495 RepID=UPI003C7E14D8